MVSAAYRKEQAATEALYEYRIYEYGPDTRRVVDSHKVKADALYQCWFLNRDAKEGMRYTVEAVERDAPPPMVEVMQVVKSG